MAHSSSATCSSTTRSSSSTSPAPLVVLPATLALLDGSTPSSSSTKISSDSAASFPLIIVGLHRILASLDFRKVFISSNCLLPLIRKGEFNEGSNKENNSQLVCGNPVKQALNISYCPLLLLKSLHRQDIVQ